MTVNLVDALYLEWKGCFGDMDFLQRGNDRIWWARERADVGDGLPAGALSVFCSGRLGGWIGMEKGDLCYDD